MNEQQLAAIEKRWSEASSGPWHVLDRTLPPGERGFMYTSSQWVKEFQDKRDKGEPTKLRSLTIRSFEDAFAHGVVKDKDEWIKLLESKLVTGVDADLIFPSFKAIYCCTRSYRERCERKVDLDKSNEEPQPSFLIPDKTNGMDPPKEADLIFLLHASQDIGDLLVDAKKHQEEIDSYRSRLAIVCEQRDAMALRLKNVNDAITRLKTLSDFVKDL